MINKLRKYSAYTVAEVLITMTALGIIAALVIPTLFVTSFKAGTIAKVKKTHKELNEIFTILDVKRGSNGDLSRYPGIFNSDNMAVIWIYLKPYFKIVKDCENLSGQGCFPSEKYKRLDGEDFFHLDNDTGGNNIVRAILADGSLMYIRDPAGYCNNNQCAYIIIDTNGHRGPNTFGKDTFEWTLLKSGKVIPFRGGGYISADCHTFGTGCSEHVLRYGNMDYY